VRKRQAEHVNHERWLVSYADLVTLLFAFFVVLYSSSKLDAKKFKAVSESLNGAFTGKSVPKPKGESAPVGIEVPAPMAAPMADDEMKQISDSLEQSLRSELMALNLSDQIQIFTDARGVVARIAAEGFYENGSAEVKPQALPVLEKMAQALRLIKHNVRVEGHTDNTKITSEYYPSNWELSTARATWIVRYFILKNGFDPTGLSAAGYAEYRPIADNTLEEGRKKNRRVEIVVLKGL
jgi:chemotaxis protein MotB